MHLCFSTHEQMVSRIWVLGKRGVPIKRRPQIFSHTMVFKDREDASAGKVRESASGES